MQHLNSVLLEGVVSDDPIRSFDPDSISTTTFTFVSRRIYKDRTGKPKADIINVPVLLHGITAVAATPELLYKGRGLRLVGRLAWAQVLGLHLFAEHVEYKPVRTTT